MALNYKHKREGFEGAPEYQKRKFDQVSHQTGGCLD